MPRLSESQYSPSAVRNAGQVKKNSAARAPMWNAVKAVAEIQFTPSRLRKGAECLTIGAVSLTLGAVSMCKPVLARFIPAAAPLRTTI
jgi:hypothetical protein